MTPHPSHAFSLTRCVRCGCPPRSLTARIECVAVIRRDIRNLTDIQDWRMEEAWREPER